jgi:putative ABC transport system permease protein
MFERWRYFRKPMHTIALFFRLWTWFSYRQMSTHRWRAVAVLLGIALGSAVFTSVRLAVDASVDSFTQSVDTITGKADRVITRSEGRVPERLVTKLLKHPAVLAASPRLTTYVQASADNIDPILLIGLDPVLDRPLRSRQTVETASTPSSSSWIDLMGRPRTLFAGTKLAETLHLKAGDLLPLEHVLRKETFQVLGILPPEGLATAEGGFVAITDIATFQEFTGLLGFVDRIDLLLKPNVPEDAVDDMRATLPDSVLMEPASEAKESGRLMIRSYQLNLSVLSFVSLFVGMFLVYSLVSLHATSRRHELAVLRSIGASPSMLFFLFLSEGTFLGIVGWIGAIPLSSIMVKHLIRLVSSTITHLFVRVQVDRLILDPFEILLSFLITVVVSTLAALQPAYQAMKVPPRESLLMVDVSPRLKNPTRGPALLGTILILLAWPLSKLPPVRSIPLWAYFATFLLFSGFSLLSPHFLRIMGSYLPPLLRRIAGPPAFLAGRYVRDGGTRIAISVGALITAVALFVALAIMVHSFRGTVELWVNQTISGDLFVTPRMATLNRYRDPLPDNLVTELLRLRTHADIVPYRRLYLNEGKHPYLLEAIEIETFSKHAGFLFLKGDAGEIMPKLIRGEGVVVSEVFSNQASITVGDTYSANVDGVKIELPVLGIFRDYRTQGGVVNYSLAHFSELTGDSGWSGARVHFRDRTRDTVMAAEQERKKLVGECLLHQQAVDITLGEDLRHGILRIFDETFAITTTLLIIALLVAALGITTTLTVLVLERSRQIHTLIAGGAARGQIRAMIFWEAILMVTAAEVIGLACGGLLSLLLIFVINRQSFGWTFMVSVDWTSLLVSFPLILATGLLAALPAGQLVFKRTSALVLRER